MYILYKAILYRALTLIFTFGLVFIMTGSIMEALHISFILEIAKTIFYITYELCWKKCTK